MRPALAAALLVGGVVAGGIVGGAVLPVDPAGAAEPNPPSGGSDAAPPPYPGDPQAESLLVAAEEDRLTSVRESAQVALRTGIGLAPYRLSTGDRRTLVLVARPAAYTLDELVRTAPVTIAQQPDGSYLVSESIVVQEGATLSITSDQAAVVHLSSGPDGFVSIVGIGGAIQLGGVDGAPVTIKSWDPATASADLTTADGRSYVRVIGGSAEFTHVVFADLGFWSGRTGGVALTGTESAADDSAADLGDASLLPADGSGAGGYDLTPDDDVSGVVTGRLTDISVTRGAFGLFVTRADGVSLVDSAITGSLVGGVVFHRDVTNSRISRTTSKSNAIDGFAVTRASTGVIIEGVTAIGNGRNGISLEGAPLAEGPSATGTSVASYGKNQVRQSRSAGNLHYGIAVVGGSGIVVEGNAVGDGEMGIVVSHGAEQVTIIDNEVRRAEQQGIALRNAGTDAMVTGNTVQAGLIGVYARDAGGTFEDNWIEGVESHGIALVGKTGESIIRGNTISGSGPSAIDVDRTKAVTVGENATDEWTVTRPLPVVLRSIFRPLTVVWILLAIVLIATAISVARRGRQRGIRDPYAENAPAAQLHPRGRAPGGRPRRGRGIADDVGSVRIRTGRRPASRSRWFSSSGVVWTAVAFIGSDTGHPGRGHGRAPAAPNPSSARTEPRRLRQPDHRGRHRQGARAGARGRRPGRGDPACVRSSSRGSSRRPRRGPRSGRSFCAARPTASSTAAMWRTGTSCTSTAPTTGISSASASPTARRG